MTDITATIKTDKGEIKLELHSDKAPMTVANFVNLALRGFYNDLNFHRVIDNFMIQWWCPQGTWTWWPGYQFADEFHPELLHDTPWVLSMANSWPHSNGSQFFITHAETPRLNGAHTVFGRVVSEDDQWIVNAVSQWDAIEKIEIEGDVDWLFKKVEDFMSMVNKALEKDE